MAGSTGEGTPTPQPIPGADTSKAQGDLGNPVEGVAGGYSEEQQLAPEGVTYTVSNKALTSNVATLTIGAHTINVGALITVTGVDAVFNVQNAPVTAVAATTVSYAKTNTNVVSAGATGTVTVEDWQNAVNPETPLPIQPSANQALPDTDKGVIG